MNPIKSEVPKFAPTKLFSPLNLTHAGQFLPDAEAKKSLGLQLDRQISWKYHVSFFAQQIDFCLLYNDVLTFDSLKCIHFAHFQSVID